jgi:site-specific recombinase XerC
VADGQHEDTPGETTSPAPIPLPDAIEEFFVARRPRKDSPHTSKAYSNDLRGIGELLARSADTEPDELTLANLTVPRLRSAFADYADSHAKASINRCWSTWNQFFTFLVAEGLREGNRSRPSPRPNRPRRLPKPLDGEDTPEQLLQAAASGRRRARNPWPERDLAVLATLLLTGLRSAELLDMRLDSLAGRPGARRLQVLGEDGPARSGPSLPDGRPGSSHTWTSAKRARDVADVTARTDLAGRCGGSSRRLSDPAVRRSSHWWKDPTTEEEGRMTPTARPQTSGSR